MKIVVGESFFPLLSARSRYLVMSGGGGSGKSEFAARKLFYRSQTEPGHRFLILRKIRRRVKESVIEVVLRLLAENEVPFTYNRSDRIIRSRSRTGVTEWLFDGLDDPEKIKSIKGITSVWVEEATEFTAKDFLTIDLRLREPVPTYHQIMLTFNPEEARAPWLKERFFDRKDENATVHVSTIDDNPIAAVRLEYRKILDELINQDEAYYQIYRLGRWARAHGLIYDWDVVPLPDIAFDETFYGGDFGYSVNPAAVVRVYRKAHEFWVQQVVYETGLTNQALAARMREEGMNANDTTYWDSAEPKSIKELNDAGFTALEAVKGADSVRAGIDFLKAMTVHVVEGSDDLEAEAAHYKWRQDRNGRTLPEPVKFKDHLLDAVRYAIHTHCGDQISPRLWSLA